VKVFDAGKTRMIGLPYGEKNYDNYTLSHFHTIVERNGRTDRRTDGRTYRFALSISRVNMLTRIKKRLNAESKMETLFSTFSADRCECVTGYRSHAVRRVELISYFLRFRHPIMLISLLKQKLRLLFKNIISFCLNSVVEQCNIIANLEMFI